MFMRSKLHMPKQSNGPIRKHLTLFRSWLLGTTNTGIPPRTLSVYRSYINSVCVGVGVGVVTGCSSRITATWTKKSVDKEVLYSFVAAVLTHGWLPIQNRHTHSSEKPSAVLTSQNVQRKCSCLPCMHKVVLNCHNNELDSSAWISSKSLNT